MSKCSYSACACAPQFVRCCTCAPSSWHGVAGSRSAGSHPHWPDVWSSSCICRARSVPSSRSTRSATGCGGCCCASSASPCGDNREICTVSTRRCRRVWAAGSGSRGSPARWARCTIGTAYGGRLFHTRHVLRVHDSRRKHRLHDQTVAACLPLCHTPSPPPLCPQQSHVAVPRTARPHSASLRCVHLPPTALFPDDELSWTPGASSAQEMAFSNHVTALVGSSFRHNRYCWLRSPKSVSSYLGMCNGDCRQVMRWRSLCLWSLLRWRLLSASDRHSMSSRRTSVYCKQVAPILKTFYKIRNTLRWANMIRWKYVTLPINNFLLVCVSKTCKRDFKRSAMRPVDCTRKSTVVSRCGTSTIVRSRYNGAHNLTQQSY